MEHVRSSRTWIATTGPRRRRVTTLTFVLPHAGRVVFVVEQVSPVCRTVGRFSVRGHAGRNRIHFPRPASRLRLVPGTYRISVRTRLGQQVERVTIVVVDRGAPSRGEIAAAQAANVCAAAGSLAAATRPTGASNTSNLADSHQQPSASGPLVGTDTHSHAVLGTTVAKAVHAVQPLLVALLAVAIVLLGIASLPRLATTDSRANEFLARHRLEIAGLGAAVFAAVVIVLLLG